MNTTQKLNNASSCKSSGIFSCVLSSSDDERSLIHVLNQLSSRQHENERLNEFRKVRFPGR